MVNFHVISKHLHVLALLYTFASLRCLATGTLHGLASPAVFFALPIWLGGALLVVADLENKLGLSSSGTIFSLTDAFQASASPAAVGFQSIWRPRRKRLARTLPVSESQVPDYLGGVSPSERSTSPVRCDIISGN